MEIYIALADVNELVPSLRIKSHSGQAASDAEASLSLQDFKKLLRLVLANVSVDEKWYLSQYTDVQNDVRKGALS